jgi:methanogenic corrinoid protein MtbC1
MNFCSTFVRQIVFSFLSSSNSRTSLVPRRIVCATLTGDFNEKALMMVSAHLKYQGWGIYYLGCNMSAAEICRFSEMTRSTVYISVSDKETLEREMAKIRKIKRPVFLGGQAVQQISRDDQFEGDLHFIESSGVSAAESVMKFAESYQ